MQSELSWANAVRSGIVSTALPSFHRTRHNSMSDTLHKDFEIDVILSAWLRGSVLKDVPHTATNKLVARIDHHGIAGLLSNVVNGQHNLSADLQNFLRNRAIALAYWEANHAHHLVRTLTILRNADVTPIVFKGTALAYSAYDAPFMRVRGDSDVLVAPDRFVASCTALASAGYDMPYSSRGDLVSAARVYRAPDTVDTDHDIDLHQRISSAAVIAQLFSFEELLNRAQPLSVLGAEVLGTGPLDALMIACFHRQVHAESPYFVNGKDAYDPNRMIWLADIHLLAQRLNDTDWLELSQLCETKGLGRIVAQGLRAASAIFATQLPVEVMQNLEAQLEQTPPQYYLSSGSARRTFLNIAASTGIVSKLLYLAELIFPPPDYVRAMFPLARLRWLPWLYIRYVIGRSLGRIFSKCAPRP